MKRWYKIGIGAGIAGIALMGLGALGWSGLRSFFYPPAPPMPVVVSEPMPEILVRLEHVLKTDAPNVLDALQPGLSAGEISKLELLHHVQLPEEIKAIYQWHNGSARTTNYLSGDFIPIHRFLPLEEALAERSAVAPEKAPLVQRVFYRVLAGHRDSWIALFSDGAGDGYWYDPKRSANEGAIFYNFTDTASFVCFPSARNLMAGIAKCYQQGAFRLKIGSAPPELDEDFAQAEKIWAEFGASN